MASRPAPQLAELLGLLRNARDPWSRLRLVAQGARALSRLTPAQRGDLLRTLGLEGAEELAELAAGGDPKVAQTLEGVLRSLENDPRRVQQIARDLADPNTRRGTLTGLAAHVMEVVTAPAPGAAPTPAAPPPPPAPPMAKPAKAKSKAARSAAAEAARAPSAAAAAPAPPRTASPAAPASAQRPPAPPLAQAAAAAAAGAAVAALEAAPSPAPAAAPAAPRAPSPSRPVVQATPPPWASTPRAPAPDASAAPSVPIPIPPTVPPKPASPIVSSAPELRAGAAPEREGAGALQRLRSLRRALDTRQGVSAESLAELVDLGLASDWARRRALAAAFARGVPAAIEEALALVGRLASPGARRWALGDLAASRAWSDAEWERLLAAADGDGTRRRLAALRARPRQAADASIA